MLIGVLACEQRQKVCNALFNVNKKQKQKKSLSDDNDGDDEMKLDNDSIKSSESKTPANLMCLNVVLRSISEFITWQSEAGVLTDDALDATINILKQLNEQL